MSYLGSEYVSVNPLKSESVDMGIKVQQMKQGKYDAAKSLIDQTLAQYNDKLKGLRDEDNQYIAEKLKNVKSQIDIYSKTNGDLSKSYNRDSIMSAITSTLQDPIVQDAIVSRNNYMQGNAQVEKLREKDGGKYISQKNIDYSWNQVGLKDYMSGKTKKLGAMTYIPYSDYKENAIKHAKDFAQQNGQEQLLQENRQHGRYHTVDIYGKIVKKEDLKNYLSNVLSEQDKKQIEIDAWYEYKDTTDENAKVMLETNAKVTLKDLETNFAEQKAKLDGGDKTVEPIMARYKEAIENTKNKINTRNFSKNDLYNDYANKSLDGIADGFDMNIITKKDVDNATFEELKFDDSQKKWALDYNLKLETLEATKKTNTILEAQSLGTRFDKPVIDDSEEEVPQDLLIRKKVRDGAISLKEELTRIDPEFAKMSESAKFTNLLSLNLSNVAESKKYPQGFSNRLREFQQAQRALSDMTLKVNDSYRETANGAFNDMAKEASTRKGELSISGISEYAPMTGRLLEKAYKTGKTIDFNNLTPDERKIVQIELMNANIKQDSNINESVKRATQTAINSLLFSVKDKNLVASAKKNIESIRQKQGYFEEGWNGVKQTAGFLYDVGSEAVDSMFINPFEYIKEGSEYANKKSEERSKNRFNQDVNTIMGVSNFVPVTAPYRVAERILTPMFKEEEDLNNIESRDVGGKLNVGDRFKSQNIAVAQSIKIYTDGIKKNLDFNYAFMFDTSNKAQKPIADLIEQTVKNTDTDLKPSKDNNYSIQQIEGGYKIQFDTKDSREEITVSKLPQALSGIVDQSKENWTTSVYNPLVDFSPVSVTPILDNSESKRRVNNIFNEYPEMPSQYANIILDTEKGLFKPAIEYIRQNISKPAYEKNKAVVDKFVNQKFIAETEIDQLGRLVSDINYIDVDGQPKSKKMYHSFTEKNDALLNLEYYSEIDKIKKERLNSLSN